VQEMISQGIQAELGGQEREMTILFTDLVGFTSVLEKYGNALIPQLGEYLNEISEVFIKEKGSIDKYIGDSIMAFWGAPVKNEEHAKCACKAALDAHMALNKMRIIWENDGKPLLHTRVGINTGVVLVGNVGSGKRLNYTVVGDPVNMASRLEGLNKVYKTTILIGQNTFRKAMEHVIARKVDSVCAYGKSEREDIYELIAMRDDLHVTDNFDWIKVYENAHRLYQERAFAEAIKEFKRVPEMKGKEDYPTQLMLYYCFKYQKTPPPLTWDGVSVMKSK
jgi:adenylate cyclase